jgi:abortive infection bacteriophage resistance protein
LQVAAGHFTFPVTTVRYTKPALTFEQQADQLLARGMVGNRATMISRLSFVNYYRLSGYWWPYRKLMSAAKTPGSRQLEQRQDDFVPGTEFETVWDHYVYDQRLRLHVMEAIERIEVAARTQLAYHHSRKWGADAYAMNRASLPRLTNGPISDRKSHAAFVAKIGEQLEQGKNQPFVHHFRTKYTSSAHLPIWMAVELMSIGSVTTMYQGCLDDVQELVARPFGVTNGVFGSWLVTLQHVRNICAHHGRLWNRALVKEPKLPPFRMSPEWYSPSISITKVYAALTVCNYLLNRITSASSTEPSTWAQRLVAILGLHTRVPIAEMGFPARWLDSPLWSNAK